MDIQWTTEAVEAKVQEMIHMWEPHCSTTMETVLTHHLAYLTASHLQLQEAYRVNVAGTASAGGNLIETQLLADSFIEALRDRLAVADLGATFISGLVGNVDIPKCTGSATAYWFGSDNSDSVTESTGTIGHVSMTPKIVGALSKFSSLMDLQSTPDNVRNW